MTTPDFYADAPVAGSVSADTVRPYGLLGLVFSFIGILSLGAALMGAGAGLWIAIAGYESFQASFGSLGQYEVNEIRNAPYQTQMIFYGVTASSFIGFGLATLIFARWRGGAQWRVPVAWHESTSLPSGRVLSLLILLALGYLLAVSFGVKFVYPQFRTWFFVPEGVWGIALSFVTVVLLAPWAEELIFRGWIYTSLRHSFGVWAAVAVTAFLFAIVHMDATGLYPILIFIPGLLLTLIREKFGTAKASFLAHAAYNGMAWLMVFFVGNP